MTPEELLAVVAWLYYKEGLTQERIARRLGLSRVKVTRLLARAREEGVVEFRITRPLPERFRLEEALLRRFGLAGAVVAEGERDLGPAAAEFLARELAPGCRLGLGWSTTVRRMAPYLYAPRGPLGGEVVELVGSFLGQENPYSISARAAEALGCRLVPLPAPVLLSNPRALAALLEEPGIRRGLEAARGTRLAVVGVGRLDPEGTLVKTGMLTREEAERLRQEGAVGDVLMRFFDANGRPLATSLDERVLALGWEDFLRIPRRVAVAAGPAKVPVLRAALAGGLFTDLVTDAATARALLEEGAT